MTTRPESGPTFSRQAPPGLPPQRLIDRGRAMDRNTFILEHGFTREQLKPDWWQDQGIEIRFPSTLGGQAVLTRGDLFAMAASADSEAEVLDYVWHVLAWGSDNSRRNNRQRIASCRAKASLLCGAINAAHAGETRTAYGTLIPTGAVPYLGPAFFSKILYFASGAKDPRCLILDTRVARSLYDLGWSMAPRYPTRNFYFRWHTDTYVSYCEHLATWATDTKADVFERLLFEPDAASVKSA